MPPITLASVLQVVLALGLLNVWLLRPNKATGYRGGTARNLKEEFATYGLPDSMFYIVGGLKLAAAAALLAGLWMPKLALAAAVTLIVLMAGAVAMHQGPREEVHPRARDARDVGGARIARDVDGARLTRASRLATARE